MRRKRVQSSTLNSVGYDKSTRTLELEFTSREVYQYTGVPNYRYVGLINAPSLGKYFNMYIKDEYPTFKVSR